MGAELDSWTDKRVLSEESLPRAARRRNLRVASEKPGNGGGGEEGTGRSGSREIKQEKSYAEATPRSFIGTSDRDSWTKESVQEACTDRAGLPP